MMEVGPLLPALILIAAATWFGLRDRNRFVQTLHKRVSAWVLGIAAGAALLLAWDTAVPSTPLASAALQVSDAPLHIDLGHRSALLITGELPAVSQGTGASGTYVVDVTDASGHVRQLPGRIEEHWEQHRVGRRGQVQTLTVHNDVRYELPAGPLDLSVASKDGSLSGPLTLKVLAPPPPEWLVAGAAVVLTVAAVVLEAREKGRTAFSLDVGVLGAFAALLATGVTPASPTSEVVGTGFVSLLVGAGGAMVLRLLVGDRMATDG